MNVQQKQQIKELIKFINNTRLIQFLFTGGTGVLLNISLTAFFTEVIFGREQYFYGYLIGLSANLVYNFTLHTIMTFKTKKHHKRRFVFFIIYSLLMAALQAKVISVTVAFIGVNWYIPIIMVVIGIFSIITFLVLKFGLFKTKDENK